MLKKLKKLWSDFWLPTNVGGDQSKHRLYSDHYEDMRM
jgi:hypothetical protein